MKFNRRGALKTFSMLGSGVAIFGAPSLMESCYLPTGKTTKEFAEKEKIFFSISLAQWSLHRSFFGELPHDFWQVFGKTIKTDPRSLLKGSLDPLNFPVIARREYGIGAIEYVNAFYYDRAKETTYWQEMKKRCENEGVKSLLIMCDHEGNLGDTNDHQRIQAVENHFKWVDVAAFLGCHSIRVNTAGTGTKEEVKKAAVDGLGRLIEYASKGEINVIVENHGGYSSDGAWLASVIDEVDSPYCGTLPDFGNFCIEKQGSLCVHEYDRYQGVQELLPYAKGVSAKSHDFDDNGEETHTDFGKMIKIIRDAGFSGYIGIEYEGNGLSETDGIKATKKLLEEKAKQVVDF